MPRYEVSVIAQLYVERTIVVDASDEDAAMVAARMQARATPEVEHWKPSKTAVRPETILIEDVAEEGRW
jgi:hypothetical protein